MLGYTLTSTLRRVIRALLSNLRLHIKGRLPDGRLRPIAIPCKRNESNDRKIYADYAKRIEAEQHTFSDQLNVHDLPAIYHYWSNRYLRPIFEPHGFTCPDSFYCTQLERQFAQAPRSQHQIVSIGSGNCDTEIRIAQMLLQRGYDNFNIECLDLNEAMLARGKHAAEKAGLGRYILPLQQDFNLWQPRKQYSAVIANQSLHHIVELETVFANIHAAISEGGVFLTSDMIGRNGHMRWPESLSIVNEFWAELPDRYKYNHQLKRLELEYENWDCSTEGFEGIRAQDVLPLLIERFHFESFFAFANVIDVFIDRGFGHNFDVGNTWDREFIDRVQACDHAAVLSGEIKPTHILAAMRAHPTALKYFNAPLTPSYCVRRAD
jgi:SAM-dependent methyltransferase